MKKRILALAVMSTLLFTLLPAAAIFTPDDIISFADPNFEAIMRFILDKPEGPITKPDVATVTHLSIAAPAYGKIVYSLSGIEYFTALTYLECSGNQLSELDVSNNTALTTLYCGGNQLTSLDISKNSALVTLGCVSNQLTSLDVSNNTALESLICFGNQLTALDVSNNAALKELDCAGNRLVSIDVNKNTALEFLSCGGNYLTELELSKNTALTTLYCGANNLTALDITANTTLETLDCSANQLSSLDVSGNIALTRIWCADNHLTSLDISGNDSLIWLYCSENLFSDKSAVIGLNENKLEAFQFIPQKTPGQSAPKLNTASQWAWDEIVSAVSKGFVPVDIQDRYTDVITREEFCRMAVAFVEYALENDIDEILTGLGLSRDPAAFSDTEDPYILAAFALGITNGTKAPAENEPGVFTPDGRFSRQEAATMLMRVCGVLGVDTDSPPPSDFIDLASADDWAVDGINFVRAHGIMNGKTTITPKFDPKGTYTRQESILTFDRITVVT